MALACIKFFTKYKYYWSLVCQFGTTPIFGKSKNNGLLEYTAMIHISVPYWQLTCFGIENEEPTSIPHSLPAPAWMASSFSVP